MSEASYHPHFVLECDRPRVSEDGAGIRNPYSPECVEEEFYEVRIASPLYGRASYVQIREFVDPAYIRS
jgi:hypothetical protein